MRRALLAAGVLLAACSGGNHVAVRSTTTTTAAPASTTTVTSLPASEPPVRTTDQVPTTALTPAVPESPAENPNPFSSSVATVTAADLGASWHDGCPVSPYELRMITLVYVGFDGAEHTGRIVVNADVVDAVIEAFRYMHARSFPIHEVKVLFTQADVDDYETPASAGFDCRNAINSNAPPSWSQHAYGHAIDINPVENPYVQGANVIPAAGAEYLDRSNVRPGMAVPGSAVVDAFRSIGWGWGASFQDYQHFSVNGH